MKVRTRITIAFIVALLAAAPLLAGPATASTIYSTIDMSGSFNRGVYYGGSPSQGDEITIGGVPIQTGTKFSAIGAVGFGDAIQTFTIPVNITKKVRSIFTAIDSNGGLSAHIHTGSIAFIDSQLHSLSFELVEGENIRNYFTTAYIQTAPDVYGTLNSGMYRIDMQKFDLSALADLKEIKFTGYGFPPIGGVPFMIGATAEIAATPLPTSLPMFVAAMLALTLIARRRRTAI